jgi:putative ABC transport system permease protein
MKYFRKVRLNWKWMLINIVGLSVAMACLLVTFLHISQELSYDRFHSKADRICRVTTDSNNGATSMHPARVAGDWPKLMLAEYPEFEKMVRLVPFKRAIIKIGEQKFYSSNTFSTDSSFFDVFDFRVLSGNVVKAFAQPNRVFISRSIANKYFGSIDVVGKEISITHQQEPEPKVYVIDGVMEDFPVNSHFHADLLTSFAGPQDQTNWAYTYFLMKRGTDMEALQKTIQQKWEKEKKSPNPVALLYLQKLAAIHLYSHKTREMENNGDIRSVILLGTGALVLIIIALINFLNLSRVQLVASMKTVKVKLINGASKRSVALEMAAESLLISLASLLIGHFLVFRLCEMLGMSGFQSDKNLAVAGISAGFVLLIAVLSVLPLYTSRLDWGLVLSQPKEQLYSFPLVAQFVMAVVAIGCTLVLYRQMDFLTRQHPNAQNANILVVANNPWEAVQRYDLLKRELQNVPGIVEISAAMEEPGGDILDNFGFEMEGIDKTLNKSINIFTTDSNFFNMLHIRSLAGTTDLGFTPSQKWEENATELGELRNMGKGNPQKQRELVGKINELEKKLGNYHEKYILNECALKMLGILHPKDAIGKRFRLTFFLPDLFPEGEVVGVVPDFHYTNLHSAEKPLVIAPRKMFDYCFLIRIDPKQRQNAVQAIGSVWQKINPEFPFEFEYMTNTYQKVYAGEYTQSRVLSLFAVMAILLASLGVFALASFKFQRMVKEVGIRKVNGARNREILLMLNRDYMKWVAIAFVIATPVSWFSMHKWLENFAYKTELSWWIFALAGLLALGIALLTVSWQSWKAATRNPVEALRHE